MTSQHHATPRDWALVIDRSQRAFSEDSCIVELRGRIEALEAAQHAHVNYAPAKPEHQDKLGRLIEQDRSDATSSCLLELRDLVKSVRDSALHLALVTSKLGHRVEALEATQHSHIEAKAAEAGARCAVEQLRSQPGSWQPLKTETTYGEASDHARRMVRNISNSPETVEGSFEMGGKSYIYKAYSEPAAEPPASRFTAKYLFAACNIVQDSFCYDPDGSSVWFETEISHSVMPRDNIKIAHRWNESPDNKCGSTINYKVLSTSETETRSLRVRAIRVDASDSAPATAADAQQLTLVERVARRLASFASEGLPGDDALPIASDVLRDVARWLAEGSGRSGAWSAAAADLLDNEAS